MDSCCKGTASQEADEDQYAFNAAAATGTGEVASDVRKKPKKELKIRNTIITEEIELTAEEMAARSGAGDPDLEKLKSDAAEREAAGQAAGDGNGDDEAPLARRRTKDRKATGFVKPIPIKVPVVDEIQSDDVASPLAGVVQKRSKDRKGTAFVKGEMLPIQDEEEEE